LQQDKYDKRPIGLLLDRGAHAYASMWASISLGRTYVPLNPAYPLSRLRNIIAQSGVSTIVCNKDLLTLSGDLSVDHLPLIDITSPPEQDELSEKPNWVSPQKSDNPAYILFTSGSTGQPKGVPVSCDNLLAFIENMNETICYTADDRCSQVCELSFDFSVHEIYLSLLNGCTLCPARTIDLFNPAQYITKRKISVWISVPSLVRVILGNGVDTADVLNSIRLSIFNGEALSVGLARQWQRRVPQAVIWNSYGPTECTVAVSAHEWKDIPGSSESGIITIGKPFPNIRAALLHKDKIQDLNQSANGACGELLLNCTQQFKGYLDSSLAQPFINDQYGTCFYRTGDITSLRNGNLFYMGRVDNQVKIRGHRIELMEVESRIKNVLKTESLVVIAHPASRPEQLILFVEDHVEYKPLCQDNLGLPEYMIPKRTVHVDSLPMNTHGKLDRSALEFFADAA
jgi:amino acid adenylation domain-containing protein